MGKTITADSGPVTINGSGTGAGNIGLLVSHNGSNTAAVGVNFSGTGNAIQVLSSNASSAFAAVQASTNSSTTTNSAIFGQSTGAARAVSDQVEASATADVAVQGLNLRTAGGIGVERCRALTGFGVPPPTWVVLGYLAPIRPPGPPAIPAVWPWVPTVRALTGCLDKPPTYRWGMRLLYRRFGGRGYGTAGGSKWLPTVASKPISYPSPAP